MKRLEKKDKRINGVYCRILKLHLNQFNALILISRAYCIPKVTTMTVGQFVIIMIRESQGTENSSDSYYDSV